MVQAPSAERVTSTLIGNLATKPANGAALGAPGLIVFEQKVHNTLWRRIDMPGHTACRLVIDEFGWSLDGAAVFQHDGEPGQLLYHLTLDLQD